MQSLLAMLNKCSPVNLATVFTAPATDGQMKPGRTVCEVGAEAEAEREAPQSKATCKAAVDEDCAVTRQALSTRATRPAVSEKKEAQTKAEAKACTAERTPLPCETIERQPKPLSRASLRAMGIEVHAMLAAAEAARAEAEEKEAQTKAEAKACTAERAPLPCETIERQPKPLSRASLRAMGIEVRAMLAAAETARAEAEAVKVAERLELPSAWISLPAQIAAEREAAAAAGELPLRARGIGVRGNKRNKVRLELSMIEEVEAIEEGDTEAQVEAKAMGWASTNPQLLAFLKGYTVRGARTSASL